MSLTPLPITFIFPLNGKTAHFYKCHSMFTGKENIKNCALFKNSSS